MTHTYSVHYLLQLYPASKFQVWKNISARDSSKTSAWTHTHWFVVTLCKPNLDFTDTSVFTTYSKLYLEFNEQHLRPVQIRTGKQHVRTSSDFNIKIRQMLNDSQLLPPNETTGEDEIKYLTLEVIST